MWISGLNAEYMGRLEVYRALLHKRRFKAKGANSRAHIIDEVIDRLHSGNDWEIPGLPHRTDDHAVVDEVMRALAGSIEATVRFRPGERVRFAMGDNMLSGPFYVQKSFLSHNCGRILCHLCSAPDGEGGMHEIVEEAFVVAAPEQSE